MATTAASRSLVGTPDRGGWHLQALRRLVNGALIVLFVVVAALAFVTYLGPTLGFEVFTIRGRSMEPAIPIGSLAFVAPADDVRVGDVITYSATNGVVVTHRVANFETVNGERHLVTRGDASESADASPVDPSSVIGRVQLTLPLLGYVSWMIATTSGLLAIITGLLSLVLVQFLLDEEISTERHRSAVRAGRAGIAAEPVRRRKVAAGGTRPQAADAASAPAKDPPAPKRPTLAPRPVTPSAPPRPPRKRAAVPEAAPVVRGSVRKPRAAATSVAPPAAEAVAPARATRKATAAVDRPAKAVTARVAKPGRPRKPAKDGKS